MGFNSAFKGLKMKPGRIKVILPVTIAKEKST
jgi:hypothetical protein